MKFYSEFDGAIVNCVTGDGDDGSPGWRICFEEIYVEDVGYVNTIGPPFARKQDCDRAISVLESLGITPQSAVDMSLEEWHQARRKMLESLAW